MWQKFKVKTVVMKTKQRIYKKYKNLLALLDTCTCTQNHVLGMQYKSLTDEKYIVKKVNDLFD